MQLTKHFYLAEFTRSETAIRLDIDNNPNKEHIENIKLLCAKLLEPIRETYNEPFIINSGYRCPALNKAVGGAPNSQHMKGKACDIRVKNPRNLLKLLLRQPLEFDQAILYPTFLHLSYNHGANRKQVICK